MKIRMESISVIQLMNSVMKFINIDYTWLVCIILITKEFI